MGETYYDVLGVDSDASAEEIRAAYRERVLETHPDHNDAPDAAEQFRRVSTAKSVLTDGTERARYDRLGHDAYVRLAEHSSGSNGSDDADDSSEPTDSRTSGPADSSSESTGSSAGTAGTRSTAGTGTDATNGRRTAGSARTGTGRHRRTRSESARDGRTESHHARQRKRRRQQRARRRATSGWSVGSESGGVGSGTEATTGRRRGATAAGVADDPSADSEFRYAVHDWTDDVDLEWEGRPLAYSTAVTLGCLWLLYPVLVASSLTAAFPVAVNAIVLACTLGVIGYVLTRPRLAAALFGSWSVLFPLGIDWLPVSQFSVTGLVALGFAWVPFGYAVALWWTLRP